MEPRPEDAYSISKLIGVAEVDLGQVPTRKTMRNIYVAVFSDVSETANVLRLRWYSSDGTTLEKEIQIPLVMNDTLPMLQPMNSPIYKVRAGKYLKAIADVASVQLHLMYYDI